MYNSRNSVWLFPLLVILSAPVWWYPVSKFLTPRYDDIRRDDLSSSARSFVMKKAVLNQYVNGRQQWLVKADEVSSTAIEDDFRFQKIKAVLFDDKGRENIRFRGNEGLFEKKKEIITLRGRAVVSMPDEGWTLKSEKLSYSIKEHRLDTDTKVFIQSRDIKVQGSGMLYDMKSGYLRVYGRVRCDVS